MVIASLGYASMSALAKLASQEAPVLVVIFVRSVVVALVALAVIRHRKIPLRIVNRKLLLWRCVAGFVAMVAYYYAVSVIPLATAVTLHYTVPLFVALLSWVMLKERVSAPMLGCIAAAFAGVVLVLSPDLRSVELGAIAALVSALLAAFAYVAIRKLRETDSPEMIVLVFSVFAIVPSAPGLLQLSEVPSLTGIALLCSVGVAGSIGQLAMTHAYRHAKAALVSSFSYGTVLFSALAGFVYFSEGITLWAGIGSVLVVLAGVGLALLRDEDKASP